MKDQRGNHELTKVKQQPAKGGNVAQQITNAIKEKYPRVKSPKSSYAFSPEKLVKSSGYKNDGPNSLEISKMKHGLIHHSNDTKTLGPPNNLKAMPGLVLNSKGGLNVDQQVATRMRSRDQMNGCNDITNDGNFRSMKEQLTEQKPRSHDENGTKGENRSHRMKKTEKVHRYK